MRTGVLVANEWIKLRSRAATWVSLGVFLGLTGLIFVGSFWNGVRKPARAFTLPKQWGEIIGGPGVLACFFASILLILLVSGEYTWRTSRQNVIDGLSKEEFFGAKLMLLPAMAILFFVVLLTVGGGSGVAGSIVAGTTEPMLNAAHLRMFGGAFLGLLGWGSFAFLLAMTIRSSGSAIGAFFLYFIVEQILGQLIALAGKGAAMVAMFLPVATFKALWEPVRYGVVPLKQGQSLPIPLGVTLGAGAAYVVLFVAVAFWLYRRRDL